MRILNGSCVSLFNVVFTALIIRLSKKKIRSSFSVELSFSCWLSLLLSIHIYCEHNIDEGVKENFINLKQANFVSICFSASLPLKHV